MKNKKHTVYKNKNDKVIPSTTTILKIINNDSIIKWANFLGKKGLDYEAELFKAAEIGTSVHKHIEDFIVDNKLPNSFDNKLVERCFDKFLDWHKNHINKVFIESELKLVNNDFGGTVDCYCELDGKKTILDFKTSKGFYTKQFLQLAGYTILMEANGYNVEQVAILILPKNYITAKLKIITRNEIEKYIDVFNKTLDLYNLYNEL